MYHPVTTTAPRRPDGRRLPFDRDAATDALPLLAGLAPFAVLIGVATTHGRDGAAAGLTGGPLLYGGSSQLTALSLLHSGSTVAGAVTAIALINARLLAYSAALAPFFAGQPRWFRWFAPHFIIEPTYALTMARDEPDLADPRRFRSYWLTASTVVGVAWCGPMVVGAAAGPVIPQVPAVTFLSVSAFLTMLAPLLNGRPAAVAAVSGAAAAVTVPAADSVRVLVAVVVGAIAGAAAERGRS